MQLFPDNKTKIITGLVILAALSRLLPHPMNFSPVGAIALFSGCYIADKRRAFLLPLAVMFLSDVLFQIINGTGLHPTTLWVYGSFVVITTMGFYLRGREARQSVLVASLLGSVLFFLITNFGQWATGYYGYESGSLMHSYVAAIPFFRGTVMGDLFYNGVLFGTWALLKWRYPSLVSDTAKTR